jgi:histidinol-phosphate aminotransferase
LRKYFQAELYNLAPYTPGEQPKSTRKIVKLNTNENPYPPSPKIKKAIKNILSKGLLRKYSNPISSDVIREIAKLHKIPESNIMVTNGSDEGLAILFRATLGQGQIALMPYPTYSLYPVLTNLQLNGARIERVELKKDFHFDFTKLNNYKNPKARLMAFANPNAPTSILEPKTEIIELIKSFDGIVLCDEAYIDFAPKGSSLISEVKNLDNLVVSRTFSKSYGLAGLRVGYLVSNPENISQLMKIKDSYNLGMLEQAIAVAALQDQTYFKGTIKKILASRKKLTADLKKLGFEVLDSHTNFLFVKPPDRISAEEIFLYLKEREVYIRYFSDKFCKDYIRITIGTEKENKILLSKIKQAITSK